MCVAGVTIEGALGDWSPCRTILLIFSMKQTDGASLVGAITPTMSGKLFLCNQKPFQTVDH